MNGPTLKRWKQISDLLDEVLDLDPAARDAYLDAHCSDPDLRAEVEALIEAEANAPAFLNGEAADLAADLIDGDEDDVPDAVNTLSPGERLGPYRIAEAIGRGGMSTVYRAERADGQFEQVVAIKLLRSHLGTTDFVQRFRAERQILASLNHPNIARVFDGGTTDDGRPYLVMEHVEGVPITTHCDEQRLNLRERLALFGVVASAVQHAHKNLIVHRDLKPSNILVASDGTVKLLDFGIAKVLDAAMSSSVATPETRTGLHLMTPEYAAPEQVKGEAVTTSTDVYALGILLYELLTGHRPYQLHHRSAYDIVHAVCHEDPTRPSTVITKVRGRVEQGTEVKVTPEAVSEARRTEVPQLKRALSGDLDAIVLKALRKAPELRYATVDAFLDDLTAHREGHPVAARHGSAGYRVSRFVQRNRAAVFAACVVLLVLVGYAATVTVQAQRIAAERDKSEAVTSFLVDLFEETDPLLTMRGDEQTVREVLDRGSERVRTELADQPAVQAKLMTVMGEVYNNLGRYDQAEPLLREALGIHERLDPDSPDAAETKHALAYMLYRQGYFDQAEPLFREALSTYAETFGRQDPRYGATMSGLALLLDERGDLADSEAAYREAIALDEAAGRPVDPTLVHDLANPLLAQGKFEEAIRAEQQAIEGYRDLFDGPHPLTASALNGLAFAHHQMGNLEQAETVHREALAMRRATLPEGHPHIASSLVRLGWVLTDRGQHAEAADMLTMGRAYLAAILPEGHWHVRAAEGILGIAYARQGRVQEGEQLLLQSYETLKAEFGVADWRTQGAIEALAGIYAATGRTEQAANFQAMLTPEWTARSAAQSAR